jgi:hypothetical protein
LTPLKVAVMGWMTVEAPKFPVTVPTLVTVMVEPDTETPPEVDHDWKVYPDTVFAWLRDIDEPA